jgi:DNA processing protein
METIQTLLKKDYPFLLKQLPQLPDSMEMIGTMPPETSKYLCVVGSRAHSSYGKEACERLIGGLAGYPIVIVSGLALGIDSFVHESALKAGLATIAFPGSGLDQSVLYPRQNTGLAQKIAASGGAILSPFKRMQHATRWTFPTRNALMAGISSATLVIEADRDSGSLITAKESGKFNRDVLAVPGSIFSSVSTGTNDLLRNGGIAVTCSRHILEALGLTISPDPLDSTDSLSTASMPSLFPAALSDDEKTIIERLTAPMHKDEFIRALDLPAGYVNAILAQLELKGVMIEREGLLMLN